MVYCTKCGFENEDGAEFCAKCGDPLDVQQNNKENSSEQKGLKSHRKGRDVSSDLTQFSNLAGIIVGAAGILLGVAIGLFFGEGMWWHFGSSLSIAFGLLLLIGALYSMMRDRR